MGNRNAAGSRGGSSTNKLRNMLSKSRQRARIKSMGGRVRLTKIQRRMRYLSTGQK